MKGSVINTEVAGSGRKMLRVDGKNEHGPMCRKEGYS